MTQTVSTTVYDIAPILVPNNIVSFSATEFRSGVYYIQASAGSEHQMTELSIIHDNQTVYLRETNSTYTRDPFVIFSARLSDNVVSIYANTSIANTDIVTYSILMEIINKSASDTTISQEKLLESATAMKALFPDDKTDYVALQAGSLLKPHLVEELDREVTDAIAKLQDPSFAALSVPEQQALMELVTDAINLRTTAMQSSIEADIAAKKEIDNKIESAGILTGIKTSYQDPNAKALLDLTLNSTVRAALQ